MRKTLDQYLAPHRDIIAAAICHAWQCDPRERRARRREYRQTMAAFRAARGFAYRPGAIATTESDNVKLAGSGVPTIGLTLPASVSELHPCSVTGERRICDCCPDSGACTAACVVEHNGKGALETVKRARLWRLDMLIDAPDAFLWLLTDQIRQTVETRGATVVRLNTASDAIWPTIAPALFTLPNVIHYGYSKRSPIDLPEAYPAAPHRVAFSHSERVSPAIGAAHLRNGGAVAVVTDRRKEDPVDADAVRRAFGVDPDVTVVDADVSDVWALENPGPVIGDLPLKSPSAKARARALASGFVVQCYAATPVKIRGQR